MNKVIFALSIAAGFLAVALPTASANDLNDGGFQLPAQPSPTPGPLPDANGGFQCGAKPVEIIGIFPWSLPDCG